MTITIPVSNLTPRQAEDLINNINKMRRDYWFPISKKQERRVEKIKDLLQKID